MPPFQISGAVKIFFKPVQLNFQLADLAVKFQWELQVLDM
jgi:hypothetical protein